MKLNQNVLLMILTLGPLTAGAWPQTEATNVAPANGSAAAAPAPPPVTAADIQALKDALAAQQQQIQALQAQLQAREKDRNTDRDQAPSRQLQSARPSATQTADVAASPATVANNLPETPSGKSQ